MNFWGVVPARGGSKSIKLKNLLMLGGVPLIDYGIAAAQASQALDTIICSTDHPAIAARASELDIEVDSRPDHLGGDDIKVDDVLKDLLERKQAQGIELPDFIVLIQPTSPFLIPDHVIDLIELIKENPELRSAHNTIPVAHNSHAWNQRDLDDDGRISFLFAEERRNARLKQLKPALKVFGNLIAAKTSALLEGDGFYAEPCGGTTIDPIYGFDLDGPEDINIAEALVKSGTMHLSALNQ